MISLLIFTGGIVWSAAGLLVLYLMGELLWGFVCSVSFHRWCYARAIASQGPLNWWKLPSSLLKKSFEFAGHRNYGKSGTSWSDKDGGYWYGVGDWSIGNIKR